MWLPEGRHVSYLSLFTSPEAMYLFTFPHPSAPCSLLQRLACIGCSSSFPGPVASVFSNGEPWQDIRGKKRRRSALLFPWCPSCVVTSSWKAIALPRWPSPCDFVFLGSGLLPLLGCQGPHTYLPYYSLRVSLLPACLLQTIPLLSSPQIVKFKGVTSLLLGPQLL